MLSRQLVSRGFTSIRPSRLFLRPTSRKLYVEQRLLGARLYAHDAFLSADSAEGSPSSPNASTTDTQTPVNTGDSNPTTEPAQGTHGDVAPEATVALPHRSFASDLKQFRLARGLCFRGPTPKTPEERAAAKLKTKDRQTEHQQQVLAEKMERPHDMPQERFDAMTIEERIRLRLTSVKPSKTHAAIYAWLERKKAEGNTSMKPRARVNAQPRSGVAAIRKAAREKELMEMPCPEGLDAVEWSQMSAEDRGKYLSLKAKRDRNLDLKIMAMTAPPEDVAPERWDKMDLEERKALVKQREIERKVLISMRKVSKEIISKKKRKTFAAPGLQYNKSLWRAMRDEGIIARGNDLDFAPGGVFSHADTSRMNIMSRDLCDDVLERLKPSLEKHKGCDLVDINPGVGVWSGKLHDFLQPRNHILMEPDETYAGQLGNLVEKDETYKLLQVSGIIWQNLLKLEEDKMLPQQKRRTLGDPELDKPNDTLLVTLNLGYWPRRSYLGFASITHLVMHQLFTASRAHSIFQAYGQIRVLVWVHDYEKRIIIPRTLSLRKKTAIESETCSEYISEVCGADGLAEVSQRGRGVNLKSARRVRKKMEQAGISTPAHRMSRLEAEMNRVMDFGEDDATHTFDRLWLDDLEKLQKGLRDKEIPYLIHPTKGPVYVQDPEDVSATKSPRIDHKMSQYCSEPFMKWLEIKRRLQSENNQEKIIKERAYEYDDLEGAYVEVSESDLPEAEKTQQLQQLEEQIGAWWSRMDYETSFRRRRILQNIMEDRGVSQEPPLLEWDRRPYEPLTTNKDEFWPKQEMALIDIKPKTLWPSLTENALGDYDYYDMLLSCFCQNPNSPIVERLKALAPGADEWIIPRCKSLRDVKKGGVVKLEMMTVRNLTMEMLRELFEQFMAWPFRPSKGRMLQMMGSTSVHEEDVEEKGLHSW